MREWIKSQMLHSAVLWLLRSGFISTSCPVLPRLDLSISFEGEIIAAGALVVLATACGAFQSFYAVFLADNAAAAVN